MGADERAQHVWAHDGNVQSYHWEFMTLVDLKNVAGFIQHASLRPVASILYQRFPIGLFDGVLYLQATDFRII